jgi:intein-encoded DNA endonuclease-like protein
MAIFGNKVIKTDTDLLVMLGKEKKASKFIGTLRDQRAKLAKLGRRYDVELGRGNLNKNGTMNIEGKEVRFDKQELELLDEAITAVKTLMFELSKEMLIAQGKTRSDRIKFDRESHREHLSSAKLAWNQHMVK